MKRPILWLLFLSLFSTIAAAQTEPEPKKEHFKRKRWYLPFQTNAFDKNKEYHGRWKLYLQDNLVRNGRFKHGQEVGTWRYYYPSGNIYMVEKYKRNSPVIEVWRYHENGKLAKSGKAKYYNTETLAHYYWEGEWNVYDEQGNFTHTETYLKGNILKYKD